MLVAKMKKIQINFDENLFFEKVGKYLDKFENRNKEYTLAILSGLSFPMKRINKLKDEISSEKETFIKLNTDVKNQISDIDFLSKNINTDKKTEEKQMSTEDILDLFF